MITTSLDTKYLPPRNKLEHNKNQVRDLLDQRRLTTKKHDPVLFKPTREYAGSEKDEKVFFKRVVSFEAFGVQNLIQKSRW